MASMRTLFGLFAAILCVSSLSVEAFAHANLFKHIISRNNAGQLLPQSTVGQYSAALQSLKLSSSESVPEADSGFLVDIYNSAVTSEELTNENLIKIVNLENTDLECNQLCWKCLGYVYDKESDIYTSENVFPKWKEKYPNPPDLIGVTREYADPSVDKPVRDASMNLMRSIPRDFKGGVRSLESVGFRGFKLKELTPNKTRRAQMVNWLIFYREKLFGKTLEDLRAEKEAELKAKAENPDPDTEQLPSERNYQKLRLD